jgi:hypothetical protein
VAASFASPLVIFPSLINLNEILVLRQFQCSNTPAQAYIKYKIARTWELRNEKFQVGMKKEGQMEGSACRH